MADEFREYRVELWRFFEGWRKVYIRLFGRTDQRDVLFTLPLKLYDGKSEDIDRMAADLISEGLGRQFEIERREADGDGKEIIYLAAVK